MERHVIEYEYCFVIFEWQVWQSSHLSSSRNVWPAQSPDRNPFDSPRNIQSVTQVELGIDAQTNTNAVGNVSRVKAGNIYEQ